MRRNDGEREGRKEGKEKKGWIKRGKQKDETKEVRKDE